VSITVLMNKIKHSYMIILQLRTPKESGWSHRQKMTISPQALYGTWHFRNHKCLVLHVLLIGNDTLQTRHVLGT
jgi:hypothetical protein